MGEQFIIQVYAHMCILLSITGHLSCKLWTSGWFPPLDQSITEVFKTHEHLILDNGI